MIDNKMSGPILLVDDDTDLNRLVQRFLSRNGYNVLLETRGDRAADLIVAANPILVILDIMLPGLDGLSICRTVRPLFDGPILMLTALDGAIDEVAGLETGADAYLSKPVRPRVLLAHIRALLRRTNPNDPSNSTNQNAQITGVHIVEKGLNGDTLDLGDLQISESRRTVWLDGQNILLTSGEFNTLWLLANHAGKILSRDTLHRHVRGLEHDGLDRSVDQHVSKIRKKLGDDPKAPTIIKSVRGIGYLLAK